MGPHGAWVRVEECSPESFDGAIVSMKNAIPQSIVFPETFHFFHKFGVFFPLLRLDDFNDIDEMTM